MKNQKTIESIKKYIRAANYLSLTQIYLQDNFLLENKLKLEDVKPRLLGHWGTAPGINFVYANLNVLAKKYNTEFSFVLGPGHGYAALQTNLFLEGSFEKYYPLAMKNENGIAYLSKNFSWPYGFPSHTNPGTPGAICEGGELGYALSLAYGTVLDNPDLITCALIGDGEAETGPTATAWHINKFIDPKVNGTVLPILHLNGYKISGPTIFGRMSDDELISLFKGYGYEPYIVGENNSKDEKIYGDMMDTLDKCYTKIREIQKESRSGKEIIAPKFPMIILKTLKGWTSPEEIDGEKIEGNFLSHQVVMGDVMNNEKHLRILEKWLKTYKFDELFDKKEGFIKEIMDIIPEEKYWIGDNKYSSSENRLYKPLKLPDPKKFEEKVNLEARLPSGSLASKRENRSSSMMRAGEYVNEVFKLNPNNFRLFSPDETYSNRLDKAFETTTRAFVWPLEKWDKDIAPDGRVIEMLSEHTLQGLAQGYVSTGRHAVFTSYEAFIQIVASMTIQYAKFLDVSKKIPWRGDVPSFNYVITSSGWRQEHNGLSHQSPGFIDILLKRYGDFVNVYFPPDGNANLAVLEKCFASKNQINLIIAGKRPESKWLTIDKAKEEIKEGISIWKFISDDNPDIVISAAGDYLIAEAIDAINIIKKETPEIKVRFVNINGMSTSGLGDSDVHISRDKFMNVYTKDKPVIFNFHGYPQALKQTLFDYGIDTRRFSIHGYIEEGSTTTPFDMQIRNKTSRWHLVIDVFEKVTGIIGEKRLKELTVKYNKKIKDHYNYIIKHGDDPEELK